jgi:hypothetical protein
MSAPKRITATARRALETFAKGFGTEKIILNHDFTSSLLINLVSTGLATLYPAPLKVGSRTVEVIYIKITVAGRRALKGDGLGLAWPRIE